MPFADSAVRCWSFAAKLLGWRPEEFWSATPAELIRSLVPPDHQDDSLTLQTVAELQKRFPD